MDVLTFTILMLHVVGRSDADAPKLQIFLQGAKLSFVNERFP